MNWVAALLLGALQGLTEWLPVSSSGHLALAEHYFGVEAPVSFNVMLHFGTLLAVTAFFRRDFREIFGDKKLLAGIAIASIPTAVMGLALKPFFESLFSSPAAIAFALLATAAFLVVSEKLKPVKRPFFGSAFFVGVAQGLAIAPGLSRSGATIGAGLLSGFSREKAARFSFLVAIPAIAGATLLEGVKAFSFAGLDAFTVFAGVAAAAVTGYLSIGVLLDAVKKKRFSWFAAYCFVLASAVLLFEFNAAI